MQIKYQANDAANIHQKKDRKLFRGCSFLSKYLEIK
jgi:hypothetical protein